MKVLLSSLNAKYIHSALSLYALRAYCMGYAACSSQLTVMEFTVNNSRKYILRQLYEAEPDVLCFSCYIWNIEMTLDIVESIKKIRPELIVILGGPEVSYDARELLRKSQVDFVISGEGEEAFAELLHCLRAGNDHYETISGLTYRKGKQILAVPSREVMDFNKTVFPYRYGYDLDHRILYYETSRGCPFSCTYCLSSNTGRVRTLDLIRVYDELRFFLQNRVKQVKLVDRTFNCDRKRAAAIWAFLIEHDNGVTNFHFEIAGEHLDDKCFAVLERARPGFFQFEIGVQSTNRHTLSSISRQSDTDRLFSNIMRLKKLQNIHIHLDLIAGLPGEGYESFGRSFHQVYMLEPDQLQLGFLKVLKGSAIRTEADRHGIVYTEKPPYEVLLTKYLRYDEMLSLQRVEEMVELFYNADKFHFTLRYLLRFFQTSFELYEALSCFWVENGCHLQEASHHKFRLYELMLRFGSRYECEGLVKDLLQLDLLRKHNEKSPPGWLVTYHTEEEKRLIKAHFYIEKDKAKSARIERFEWNVTAFARGEAITIEKRRNYVSFVYRAAESQELEQRCRFEPIWLEKGIVR